MWRGETYTYNFSTLQEEPMATIVISTLTDTTVTLDVIDEYILLAGVSHYAKASG